MYQGAGTEAARNGGKKSAKGPIFIVILTVVLLIAAGTLMSCFVTIDEGYVGVRYQFGRIMQDNLQPGLNFKIPYAQDIISVDIREQVYDINTTAYTKDTQTVENLQIKLNYSYDRTRLSEIIRNVGVNNVASKLIVPQLQSIVKNEIGQYRAEELVQSRVIVQQSIMEKMSASLERNGILVTAFAIEDIEFESGFEEAIRLKVVAEQEALTMQNKTKEIQEIAKQKVIDAQAKADSVKIEADAQAYAIEAVQSKLDNSPGYIELQKIEKWDGKLPQAMGDNITPFINFDPSDIIR